ncbi:hypothetical protein HDV05_002886 [Chytridiales sp. JEL 0842]|nr:hypothetical protein HDV05_002886 [Chytridiales sp. JEL 0842]
MGLLNQLISESISTLTGRRNHTFSMSDIPPLHGKTVIITGASAGLGLTSTVELAKRGAQVIMACRSKSKTEEAIGKMKAENDGVELKVRYMECDLSSLASVRRFAEEFKALGLPIHVLMNNAGIMAPPEFQTSKDGIEMQMASNHLGHFYLTSLLLPILQSTAASLKPGEPSVRVVMLSSIAHNFAPKEGLVLDEINEPSKYSAYGHYGQSKLANLLHAHHLQKRLDASSSSTPLNIKCNSLHPGAVGTSLLSSSRTAYVPGFLLPMVNKLMTPVSEGALTQLYVATSPEIDEKDLKGLYFVPTAQVSGRKDRSEASWDEKLGEELWEWSERVIREKGFELSL